MSASTSTTDTFACHALVRESDQEAASATQGRPREAVRAISSNPEIGEAKVGDLVGVRVYKFRLSNQLCLLAYRILDEDSLKLLIFGPHENFYRDLKRLDE